MSLAIVVMNNLLLHTSTHQLYFQRSVSSTQVKVGPATTARLAPTGLTGP